MQTVLFYFADGVYRQEVRKLIKTLRKQGKDVWLGRPPEKIAQPEQTLLVTDSIKAAEQAKRQQTALVFYEKQGAAEQIFGADMVVWGFEEVDVCFLERVYQRRHGLPWVIAETERLVLRESVEADLEALRALYREEGMTAYMEDGGPEGADGALRFRAYIENQYRFYAYGLWTVIEKTQGKVIGRAGIENREYQGKNVLELGYMIGKKWQNRGYGEEAARAAECYAAESLGEKELYAWIHTENAASVHLIEKMGYQKMEEKENRAGTQTGVWFKRLDA